MLTVSFANATTSKLFPTEISVISNIELKLVTVSNSLPSKS